MWPIRQRAWTCAGPRDASACWCIYTQGGRRDEAAALLAEALARHEQAGGWESVSATERAVSLLVAGGVTNGAVARRRYIWPRTVNACLRHVSARLGVPGPGGARRHGASLDRVMSWPLAASTIDR